MSQNTGRARNFNDTATVAAGIAVNAVTSTLIAAANPDRLFLHVSGNSNNRNMFIKLQAAAIDDIQKGIYLSMTKDGSNRWEMPGDNIYTGEVSAITDGGLANVYVTEY